MELVVLCAIYMERLLRSTPAVQITQCNWRAVTIAALFAASKVWEDIHPWNSDFAVVLYRAVGVRFWEPMSLYRLESRLLEGLNWRMAVTGETYAAYFFALKNADEPPSPQHRFQPVWPFLVEDLQPRPSSWSYAGTAGDATFRLPDSLASLPDSPFNSTANSFRGHVAFSLTSDLHDQSVIGGSFGSMVADEASPSIDGRWLHHRWNPFVGTFRHAQPAEPPSRHINAPQAKPSCRGVGRRKSDGGRDGESFQSQQPSLHRDVASATNLSAREITDRELRTAKDPFVRSVSV